MAKTLADLFAQAAYQAEDKGELRCLTLAEISKGGEDKINHAVIFVEVKGSLGINTWIFKYFKGVCCWEDTFPGSFNYSVPNNSVSEVT